MNENQSDFDKQIIRKPLWNPKHFIILTILFSHIPVSIFYILNYHRLKEKSLRNKSITVVITITLLMVIGIYSIPSKFIVKILSLIISYGLGYYMKSSQEKLYQEHIDNGGKSAKYTLPIIVSVLFISIIIWLQIIFANVPDQYIYFLDDEIYYTNNVSVEEVNLLGEFLISIEFFNQDNSTVSVKLDYVDNTYKVYFVTYEEYIDDEEVIEVFEYLRDDLMEIIYLGSEVEIHLTDELFNTLKIIRD